MTWFPLNNDQRTFEAYLPNGSVDIESTCNAGDTGFMGLILDWKDPLEEENGNPLQYSFLNNPTYRGAWWATVHGVAESDTMEATECARLVSLQRLQPCRRMVSDKE